MTKLVCTVLREVANGHSSVLRCLTSHREPVAELPHLRVSGSRLRRVWAYYSHVFGSSNRSASAVILIPGEGKVNRKRAEINKIRPNGSLDDVFFKSISWRWKILKSPSCALRRSLGLIPNIGGYRLDHTTGHCLTDSTYGNGLLFHMTQPTSRSIIKAIACSKPTISEN